MGHYRCSSCFSFNGNILTVEILMKIGSLSENRNIEKRVAITPEIVKKYLSLGFDISLSSNYGSHLGINDEQYKEMGVNIIKDEKEVLNSSDIIVQLGMLSDEKTSIIKENQILIGVFNPYTNKEKLESLAKKKNKSFFIGITS